MLVNNRFINTTREIFNSFGPERVRYEDGMLLSIKIETKNQYLEQISRIKAIFGGKDSKDYPVTSQITRLGQWEIDNNIPIEDSIIYPMCREHLRDKVKNPMRYVTKGAY